MAIFNKKKPNTEEEAIPSPEEQLLRRQSAPRPTAESEAQIASALKTVTTPAAALAYMLFVLIYFPCLATLIAIKKETKGWGWAIFAAVYTTLLAWVVAFVAYRVGMLLF